MMQPALSFPSATMKRMKTHPKIDSIRTSPSHCFLYQSIFLSAIEPLNKSCAMQQTYIQDGMLGEKRSRSRATARLFNTADRPKTGLMRTQRHVQRFPNAHRARPCRKSMRLIGLAACCFDSATIKNAKKLPLASKKNLQPFYECCQLVKEVFSLQAYQKICFHAGSRRHQ